jgi:hypothetical protein
MSYKKLKCPHCGKLIDEDLVNTHISKRLVNASKEKFGDDYSAEMRRRVQKRWSKAK